MPGDCEFESIACSRVQARTYVRKVRTQIYFLFPQPIFIFDHH